MLKRLAWLAICKKSRPEQASRSSGMGTKKSRNCAQLVPAYSLNRIVKELDGSVVVQLPNGGIWLTPLNCFSNRVA